MITHKAPRSYPIPDHDDLKSCYDWTNKKDDNILLRISKSSLGEFTFCEQQYFIKRCVGMKEPQNENMLRGTNVHDAVELFYNTVDVDYAKTLTVEELKNYFKESFPIPAEPYYLDEDLHIDRFIDIEVARFLKSNPYNFLPTGNEMVVNHIESVEVDGIKQDIHFTGIIDRIFTNPDGSLHIHELKTGQWKESKFKLENMRKEMAFYVWLMRKAHPTSKITHWGWDHTKGLLGGSDGAYRFVEPVRVKEITLFLTDLQNLIRSHRKYGGEGEGSMFKLLPSGAQYRICDPWCALKEFCPRYRPEDLL